jgi:hypothetical protein
MPRAVLDKLDRVRIKLHLRQWQQLSLEERRRLRDDACDSPQEVENYRSTLIDLIRRRTGGTPDEMA